MNSPIKGPGRNYLYGQNDFIANHKWYKWFVLANVMIGTFMAVLDATIVNVGLPKIMASFGVSVDKIEWVLTAYMLSTAVMLPTSPWLSDKFGYKKMYMAGLALFTLGSFLCGLSPDENFLIIARVIQGAGAGFIQPVGMAIITREFPPQQLGIALGFWVVSAAASVSFGPLIGGYLVDNFSWQLIFDVNVPVGILGILLTVIIQKEYKNKNVKKFDIVGFISAVIFLPVLLYALSEGNARTNSEGWAAPHVLICFAITIIAFAVFITTEFRVKEPLLDLRLLGERNFGLTTIMRFIFSVGLFGSTFLLPLYLQNALDYTAFQSGAVFLPVGILQGIMSPITGIISDKTSPKIPIVVGFVLLAISLYMNSLLSFMTEHSYIMLTLYLRGLGMGIAFAPLSSLSYKNIKREQMAQASGLFNIVRQIGGSFGVAILTTVLTSRVNYHTQMYGNSLDPNSPAFKNFMTNMHLNIMQHAGSSYAASMKQSSYVLFSDISKQAFIQGINDDFLLAAVIIITVLIPMLWMIKEKKKAREPEAMVKAENLTAE